ncbi:LOW QUALITY PROTEIN: coiled-coil domain-containing protein 77 [Procambarus clarkii]|uniref:LOW QUALITY PROTEIN: coiled-coil domain-containing protein 77 n=1 Tax=Procambarus clarkii TaxID=6728 RepID=UPI001E673CDC|nr:coiled-coil domain-containing protein 77-like [Procambarus clarkii]
MAAVERLRSSIKRVNSCGRRSRASTPASSNGQDINIDEELAKLQPSVCLLDFYRQKIATFGERQQEMLQLLEKYQQTTKSTFLEEERRQLTSELIELRSALSDVNVFIHAERQQVVRLYSENERLKLDNLEAEKKVALLLSLCGLSEGELKVFLRDPCRTTIIKQKLPPHLKKIHIKLKEDFQETGESEATLALKACVKSLETQLEESDKTWRRERNAFIQDRSLLASESKAQAAKDEAHIKLLTARLEEAERLLSETVEDALRKSADVQTLEMTWLAERDHLLSVLSTVQENMPLVTQMQTIGRTGSYTDLSKMKSTCELKDLRREIESIKREASEAEELRTMYESQCLQLEQKMCKLREQKEAAMQIYKERNQKLLQQIEMLKQDKIRLDERRRTDIKGFQADIRLLKNDVKTVVHQLFKITITLSGADNLPVDISALSEMQAVAALVRTVQNAVAETKRKILKLENEMNNPSD